jgi:hypothetical protein
VSKQKANQSPSKRSPVSLHPSSVRMCEADTSAARYSSHRP